MKWFIPNLFTEIWVSCSKTNMKIYFANVKIQTMLKKLRRKRSVRTEVNPAHFTTFDSRLLGQQIFRPQNSCKIRNEMEENKAQHHHHQYRLFRFTNISLKIWSFSTGCFDWLSKSRQFSVESPFPFIESRLISDKGSKIHSKHRIYSRLSVNIPLLVSLLE